MMDLLQESESCILGTEMTKTVVKITKLFLQCVQVHMNECVIHSSHVVL